MDAYLGMPSILWGNNSVRRKLYGKAGAFRFKSYGCEYRTPDNAWLMSRDRMKFVAQNAIDGMTRLYGGGHVYNDINPQAYIDRGNNYSKSDYRYVLERNKIAFLDDVKEVKAETPKRTRKKKVTVDIEAGIDQAGAQPRNIWGEAIAINRPQAARGADMAMEMQRNAEAEEQLIRDVG